MNASTTVRVYEVRDGGGVVAVYTDRADAERDAGGRRQLNARLARALPASLGRGTIPPAAVEVYGPTPLTDVNRPYLA